MGKFFISHSSVDNALALALADKLRARGYDCFLDFDRIAGGSDWEKSVHDALRRSIAVIVCSTPESMESNWVFAEIAIARYSGIPVIPLIMRSCELPTCLKDTQYIDFTHEPTAGYARLWKTLEKHNFSPSNISWPKAKSPYPGLRTFTSEYASVFFGRERELESAIVMLRQREGIRRFLSVIGPSGIGKSSFLRAGLIPALKRGSIEGSDEWIYLQPFKPGQTPFRNLAERLYAINSNIGNVQKIENRIKEHQGLLYTLLDIRSGKETNVVMVIDQFEELISMTEKGETREFLDVLVATINSPGTPLIIINSMRADFIDAFFEFEGFPELLQENNIYLGALNRASLRRVISGPAHIAGFTFEEGLIEEILDDTRGGDALPLLAHVLYLLWIELSNTRRSNSDYSSNV